eukprot:TRINITY_DN7555_c0_g1_i1.p1 TRINITY_DN7555_c0_g1~~TRINITY_DN7555_c0_g1_i1.p1  ORF type:complete len:155 (+),score=12.24 TRINITY_DN7555_c0_g1_i1:42-506(+)
MSVELLSLDNPAFRTFCQVTVFMAIKQFFVHFGTGLSKATHQQIGSPEDKLFVPDAKNKTSLFGTDHPVVKRWLAATRNDHENIYIFYIVGLLYVLCGASPFGAKFFLYTFLFARIGHSISYLILRKQPHRAICMMVGMACQAAMLLQIFWASL